MNTDESLSNVFNVPHVIEPKQEDILPAVISSESSSEKIEDDYDHARNNLRDLLTKGKEALETSLTVAKQSEHPRAFEVVGGLMKQLADINQQLMDIHQQKKKLEEPTKGTTSKEVTNNNAIFVGSTADLSKMIKKMTGE